MCIFGSRSDSPPHASPSTELTAPSSTNEQQETISGVDMMIRHFRSRSFREYQMRNSPSPCPSSGSSRSPSSNSYHTPSPHLSQRSLLNTSPNLLRSFDIRFTPTPSPDMTHAYPCTPTPCISNSSSTLSSACVTTPYNNKQHRVFTNLITET